MFVREETFWQKLLEIESSLARKEGSQRGWFTYTELENLLTGINPANLLQALATVLSVLTVTYTAGILAILSSIFIVSNIPGSCLQRKTEAFDPSLKTEIDNPKFNLSASRLDAADMFKTTLILASIQTNSGVESDLETWNWWSKDSMVWLSESSKMNEAPMQQSFYPVQYTDASVANEKSIDLQDQVHKATKLRIQDQMEHSWHTEWTDSLKLLFRQKVFA